MERGAAGRLGSYSMMRDASGTSWQPDATPMAGLHGRWGEWITMLHGAAFAVFDGQGGAKGAQLFFSESMLMGAAQRQVGQGVFSARAMLSLDPLMGKSGYPLLLQTGETADGHTPLLDRQHPHDLFMELALMGGVPLSAQVSGFLYAGYPGDPALGPPVYMHRFSGLANPEAPITHHWLDSTHVSFGVLTSGIVAGNWKVEGSVFNGREPDQFRWNFDPLRLDSYSGRISWNPLPAIALQLSYGAIHSPEQLQPDVNQRRATASALFERDSVLGHWQTTLAWGQNQDHPGHRTNALLIESALQRRRNTFFARGEQVAKDELIATGTLAGAVFTVTKLSLGDLYELAAVRHGVLGLGALLSAYELPAPLHALYGAHPTSFMLYARLSLQ